MGRFFREKEVKEKTKGKNCKGEIFTWKPADLVFSKGPA